MGMTYAQYLKSPTWFLIKSLAFREKRFQSCFICGSLENLQLHHKKYRTLKHIGKIRRQLSALVSLCGDHHAEVHRIAVKGNIGLNYSVKKLKRKFEKKKSQMNGSTL